MDSLLQLPSECLHNVLYFLPQQSLINLALTNFHFYEPCLRHLYKRIHIQVEPTLRTHSKLPLHLRRDDFVDASVTVIAGFSSVQMSRQAHLKMVEAKLRTLTNAILVNPQLAFQIEEIVVSGTFNKVVEKSLLHLFEVLSEVPNALSKVYVADVSLRRKLGYHTLKYSFLSLTSITVDDVSEIAKLDHFKKLKEVVVANIGNCKVNSQTIDVLNKIQHLHVNQLKDVSTAFHSALLTKYRQQPFVLRSLKTVDLVFTHSHTQKCPYIDFSQIENLQLSLGCDHLSECDYDCVDTCLADINLPKIKRLAILQNSDASLNNHRTTERWDLIVFEFVKLVVEQSQFLFYLAIRHNVPLDARIDDGFEGNYLRKVKLYTYLLPNLLATMQRHVVNLVLPNLIASLSCYEQPMNTFMWNGCKCGHCETYLEKLDDYLLHHRYYSFDREVFKDVLTTQLVRSMSEVLSDRMCFDPNLGDLGHLTRPMTNTTWNFHDSKFSIPFLCLPVKNYEMADFEDEKLEKSEGKESFFDAVDTENDCPFLRKEKFIPNYSVLMSHFLNDLIRKMINLNRGNAEDVNIGQAQDENDGFTNLRINKMLINGIDYNFDHEINGTIFFKNSFDDLEMDYGEEFL